MSSGPSAANMGRLSKQKGAAFERRICRALSLWVSHNTREDIFWRSAMSGGRASIQLKTDRKHAGAQAGDISAVDKAGHELVSRYLIDCKHYQELRVRDLVFDRNRGLVMFWQDIMTDSSAFQKRPMLIAKQDYLPELICLDARGKAELLPDTPPRGVFPRYAMFLWQLDELLQTDPGKLAPPSAKIHNHQRPTLNR